LPKVVSEPGSDDYYDLTDSSETISTLVRMEAEELETNTLAFESR